MIDESRNDASQPSITWRVRAFVVNEACSKAGLLLINFSGQPVEITGQARGPLCEYATTLAAKYPLQRTVSSNPRLTPYLITIPESCLWEPEHPFRYSLHWSDEHRENQVEFGLRVLSIQRSQLLLNGQPYRFRGIADASVTDDSLRELHDLGCNLLISQKNVAADTDRLGPFVLRYLSDSFDSAREQVADAGPLQPSVACWCAGPALTAADLQVLHSIDKMTLFAREMPADTKGDNLDGADLALLTVSEDDLEKDLSLPVPWLAIVRLPGPLRPQWKDICARLDQATRHREGCIGWVAMES